MADSAIPGLNPAAPLDGTEQLHIVQGGDSVRTTALDILKPTIAASDQADVRDAIGAALKGHRNGLAIAVGTDTVNDINVAAGEAASEQASPLLMVYAGASGIQLDVAYGTGSGGRFDTSISDGTWFIFLISNGTTTGVGFSKSADPTGQANWPSGYTHYRTIGYVVRVSSANKLPVMLGQPNFQTRGTAPGFALRALVEFDGTTGTIKSGHNVASITRNGPGDYTVTFSENMPDANYAITGVPQMVSSGNAQGVVNLAASNATSAPLLKSVSAVRIVTANASTGGFADFANVSLMVAG